MQQIIVCPDFLLFLLESPEFVCVNGGTGQI